MMRTFNVNLACYKFIIDWKPQVGDIVIYHGLLFHWFGIISQIEINGMFTVIKSGLPTLLLTMTNAEMEKSKITVDIAEIMRAPAGKWAVVRNEKTTLIWYI